MSQDWIKKINDSIIMGDSQGASTNVKLSLENGVNAKDILMKITDIWEETTKLYRPGIPKSEEMDIMKKISNALAPTYKILSLMDKHLAESNSPLGTVVVACMKGDGHIIIKDVIGLLLKSSGYKVVYRVGREDTPDSLISSIKTANADALLFSAMLSISFTKIGETLEALKREGLRDKMLVVIGGGAVNEETSRKLNCDVYGNHPLKGA